MLEAAAGGGEFGRLDLRSLRLLSFFTYYVEQKSMEKQQGKQGFEGTAQAVGAGMERGKEFEKEQRALWIRGG